MHLDLSHGTACLTQNVRFLVYTIEFLPEIKGTGQYKRADFADLMLDAIDDVVVGGGGFGDGGGVGGGGGGAGGGGDDGGCCGDSVAGFGSVAGGVGGGGTRWCWCW